MVTIFYNLNDNNLNVIVSKIDQMNFIFRFMTSQEYTAETYFWLLGPHTKPRLQS